YTNFRFQLIAQITLCFLSLTLNLIAFGYQSSSSASWLEFVLNYVVTLQYLPAQFAMITHLYLLHNHTAQLQKQQLIFPVIIYFILTLAIKRQRYRFIKTKIWPAIQGNIRLVI